MVIFPLPAGVRDVHRVLGASVLGRVPTTELSSGKKYDVTNIRVNLMQYLQKLTIEMQDFRLNISFRTEDVDFLKLLNRHMYFSSTDETKDLVSSFVSSVEEITRPLLDNTVSRNGVHVLRSGNKNVPSFVIIPLKGWQFHFTIIIIK